MDLEDINEEIQRFTHRPRELVNHILKELRLIKKTFVSEGNPSLAKKTWIYRMIFSAQMFYMDGYDKLEYAVQYDQWIDVSRNKGMNYLSDGAFNKAYRCLGANLERHKSCRNELYYSSWNNFVDSEKMLDYLSNHLDYWNDPTDSYQLNLISHQIESLQLLYPFKLFSSMGSTISEKICSICEKRITSPRTDCIHENYGIYDGEMCFKMPRYKDIHHLAITRYPRDKALILFPPEGRHYSFHNLRFLLKSHPSRFVIIDYDWIGRVRDFWEAAFVRQGDKLDVIGIIGLALE